MRILDLKDSRFGFYFAVSVEHLMTEFSGSRCRRWSDVAVLVLVGEGVELLCFPDEEVIIRLVADYRVVLHIAVERLFVVRRCGDKVERNVSCAFEQR